MRTRTIGRVCGFLIAACLTLGTAAAQQRGVTDTEIIVGTMTDLSGVTAVQGVNNADAIRLAFDEVNAAGGINDRKIRYIVEDHQYQVPRAVQAINKLINSDGVFFTIEDGGTPMNNATFPIAIEKNVPKLLPLSAARSMYEPFNRLKFSQYSSYVDQMRAGVKYFVEQKGRKSICAMYQDTDFGRDVLAGANLQSEAMGLKVLATTAHKPTDTDFSASVAKLRDAKCDLIIMGTIVRDTTIIIGTARKMGWNVDFLGQLATYDTAIADAPGNIAEGFYSMSPSLYGYPDDPRPEVRELARKFKERYGFEINYLGETGYTSAQIVIEALRRAGRNLTLDSLITAMESIKDFKDILGATYTFGPNQHHGTTSAFLSVIHNGRWEPVLDHALSY
ncbi:MAG: ABC transporter substrate-binding protein [Acetobacteraceae bacterium]|nr:ABC transporter substrate-binding protein [Acetobacteraceae bacterium]